MSLLMQLACRMSIFSPASSHAVFQTLHLRFPERCRAPGAIRKNVTAPHFFFIVIFTVSQRTRPKQHPQLHYIQAGDSHGQFAKDQSVFVVQR